MTEIVRAAAFSGSIASVTSTLALAAASRAEGRAPTAPLNATSHWLHGDRAADIDDLDVRHTLVGYLTHHASAVFWAILFETLRTSRAPIGIASLARPAITTAAVAATVDYTLTPRRLTPGWEHVISKRSIAVGFGALAAGFLLAGLIEEMNANRTGPSHDWTARSGS